MQARTYGNHGSPVIVLHGGPGAPGGLAPLARQLAAAHRVYEPFQRRSGDTPVTVAAHVADLHAYVTEVPAARGPVALVGHSWGAMLALAYGAAYPDECPPLALIGCGTFDPVARALLTANRAARMTPAWRERHAAAAALPDAEARLRAIGSLYEELDNVACAAHADETVWVDGPGHEQTWTDMLRLQEAGVYPAAFVAIKAPAIMLHGAQDPHPGRLTHARLQSYMPQLEYVEFATCGHTPWLEQWARDSFRTRLLEWLATLGRE